VSEYAERDVRIRGLEAKLQDADRYVLVALAGAGICTPAEGFRKAGFNWAAHGIEELAKQRDEAFASFRDNMHRIGAAEGMHAREFDRARAAESVAEKLYDALCASGGVSALTKANASALMATLAEVKPLDFDRSEEATE
jgi:hypothetical protein